jgi:4-hydroxy-3-methylbut-2-enyl diphosphate reductase
LGRVAWQVETAADLRAEWFEGVELVGVTAGTSTLEETVSGVVAGIRAMAASLGERVMG